MNKGEGVVEKDSSVGKLHVKDLPGLHTWLVQTCELGGDGLIVGNKLWMGCVVYCVPVCVPDCVN